MLTQNEVDTFSLENLTHTWSLKHVATEIQVQDIKMFL